MSSAVNYLSTSRSKLPVDLGCTPALTYGVTRLQHPAGHDILAPGFADRLVDVLTVGGPPSGGLVMGNGRAISASIE